MGVAELSVLGGTAGGRGAAEALMGRGVEGDAGVACSFPLMRQRRMNEHPGIFHALVKDIDNAAG